MHIHILGICGTFMGGIAAIAKQAGHRVTGSDANVYPPMSTQLESLGIQLSEGYNPEHLSERPDMVVVGNVVSRGNEAMEYVLREGIPYTSGPQWLAENVLHHRHVLAVAGTHGKTTTSSMLTWILQQAQDKAPGYLIGGVVPQLGPSAALGESDYFVIEADEYDTAFFDKRSKFVHYRPRTCILNNLEYDHADIFPDLASIQRQFHHLIRTIPGEGCGRILCNGEDENLADVLEMGSWSEVQNFGGKQTGWSAQDASAAGDEFTVVAPTGEQARLSWALLGKHNVTNAVAAVAAAYHVGVSVADAVAALTSFAGIKRRLEIRGEVNQITVYDDFAHHPTAITTTLQGLRAKVGAARILAVLEPRSNTMRLGIHENTLPMSLMAADHAFVLAPITADYDVRESFGRHMPDASTIAGNVDDLSRAVLKVAKPGDHIVIMSNGGFGSIHDKILAGLQAA